VTRVVVIRYRSGTTAGAASATGRNAGMGFTPVAVSGGITTGNETYCWGANSIGQFAFAVASLGQGYCWGSNSAKLGTGPNGTDSSSSVPVIGGQLFQSISAGYGHSWGVTAANAVYCWGLNGSGQLGANVANGSTPVRAGSIDAIEVAASGIGTGSGSHSCAISSHRLTVWCWGRNDAGSSESARLWRVRRPTPHRPSSSARSRCNSVSLGGAIG
jgi:alpha-tubulin suppressor-like RCC1 family protein